MVFITGDHNIDSGSTIGEFRCEALEARSVKKVSRVKSKTSIEIAELHDRIEILEKETRWIKGELMRTTRVETGDRSRSTEQQVYSRSGQNSPPLSREVTAQRFSVNEFGERKAEDGVGFVGNILDEVNRNGVVIFLTVLIIVILAITAAYVIRPDGNARARVDGSITEGARTLTDGPTLKPKN